MAGLYMFAVAAIWAVCMPTNQVTVIIGLSMLAISMFLIAIDLAR